MIDTIKRRGHIEKVDIRPTRNPDFVVLTAVSVNYSGPLPPDTVRESDIPKMKLSGLTYVLIVYSPRNREETLATQAPGIVRKACANAPAKRAHRRHKCSRVTLGHGSSGHCGRASCREVPRRGTRETHPKSPRASLHCMRQLEERADE